MITLPSDDTDMFIAHLDIPPGGLVRLGALRDLLELMDNLPDNTLLTVQSDMIHYEESA